MSPALLSLLLKCLLGAGAVLIIARFSSSRSYFVAGLATVAWAAAAGLLLLAWPRVYPSAL